MRLLDRLLELEGRVAVTFRHLRGHRPKKDTSDDARYNRELDALAGETRRGVVVPSLQTGQRRSAEREVFRLRREPVPLGPGNKHTNEPPNQFAATDPRHHPYDTTRNTSSSHATGKNPSLQREQLLIAVISERTVVYPDTPGRERYLRGSCQAERIRRSFA